MDRQAAALQTLRIALPQLSPRDAEFATSLLQQYARKGDLSEKQWPWVEKLAEKAQALGNEPKAGFERTSFSYSERKPAAPAQDEPSFTKITEMFDKAAEELKKPRVMFAADGVGEFMVRRAGNDSRNPGYLYVVMDGEYVGKIEPQARGARFYATRECPAAVKQALTKFNADPVKAAAAYGQATGNCCFCARELTDARSVEVGYGPICADRYGLPWGL